MPTESLATPEPRVRRWTRREYYQMGELGWFEGQRVELIHGEILQMSPQRSPHSIAVGLAERALRTVFGDSYWVRIQMPLFLSENSEPEPDLAVVSGPPGDHRGQDHPQRALLIIEVSDHSLRFDTSQKASLYASAGILDYWIIDLVNGRLIVHRSPTPDASQPFGFAYAHITRTEANGFVSPLAHAGARISVADLLP